MAGRAWLRAARSLQLASGARPRTKLAVQPDGYGSSNLR
jgi:hypothetical protein